MLCLVERQLRTGIIKTEKIEKNDLSLNLSGNETFQDTNFSCLIGSISFIAIDLY